MSERRPPAEAGRLEIAVWCLYDFANSAFATTILAVIFAQYFARVVAGGPEGVSFELLGRSVTLPGASLWGYCVSASMLVVAVCAPVLGAIADFSAAKRRFLTVFWLLGCLATAGLWTVGPGTVWRASLLFILANVGFAGGNVFYNAFLPELASHKNMGRISGLGWACGYIGGGALLVVNLLMLQSPQSLGFEAGAFREQDTFLSVAIWWFAFGLWTPLLVRERATRHHLPAGQRYLGVGLRRVRVTLKRLRNYRELFKFLIAFLLYNDGIETIVVMAAVFAGEVLGMGPVDTIKFFLMVQVTAFFGSLLLGWLADKIGDKRTIVITLVVWLGVTFWARFLGVFTDARTEYWILGFLVGLIMGGSQSASRALQASFTPRANAAEFFGFFAIAGKFASIFGPATMALVTSITGDLKSGILSLAVFFGAGLLILLTIDERKGIEQAQVPVEPEPEAPALRS